MLLNVTFVVLGISVTKTQVMEDQGIRSFLATFCCPFIGYTVFEYSSSIISGYAEFEPWQQWSSCSKQCGGGKRSRNRSCTSTSIPCSGGSNEEEDCNTQACSISIGTTTQATTTQGKVCQGLCFLSCVRIEKS